MKAGSSSASGKLLDAVEKYFSTESPDSARKVCRTSLPPIFFQHPGTRSPMRINYSADNISGHSMTIIGFERHKNGTCNLLVLDPMYKTSPGIHRLIGTRFRSFHPARFLKAYRRGDSYLKRYPIFEILKYVSLSSKRPNQLTMVD